METGQRMVQRQQHGGRTVVVQPVATVDVLRKIASSAAAAFLIGTLLLVPSGSLEAVTASSEEGRQLLDGRLCPLPSEELVIEPTVGYVCINTETGVQTKQVTKAEFIAAADALGLELDVETENTFVREYSGEPFTCVPIISWDFDKCLWNPLLTALGGTLVGLVAMVLALAGSLFDMLITYAIINFGGTIAGLNLEETIGTIWTLSRDVANILIIGMFVFVAITIILGIQTYGNRKYVARILIVAIFLNFSLFLTQFAIDGSNFVAYQLYKSMPVLSNAKASESINPTGAATTTTTTTEFSGTAAAFTNSIGLSQAFDYGRLGEIGANQGPLAILGYSLGAIVLLGIVAAIFLYGAFLIATRAILLVFLLVTSALAVGAALLPGDLRKKGWNLWFSSLINVLVFAPLIMLFLFATLTILSYTGGSEGSLSAYLSNPTTTEGGVVSVIFTFIIACGLLFLSFKLAGDFAKKIGGFDYAATLPALATSLTLGAGGVLGRQTFGRIGEARKRMWEKRAQQEYNETKARTGVGTISDATMRAIKRNDWLSKQSFDARQLKPVQGVFKQSALSKVAAPLLPKDAQKRLVEGGKNGYAQNKESLQKKAQGLMEEKQKLAQKGALNAEKEKVMEQYKAEEITAAERLTTAESEFRNRPSEEAVQNAKADAERLQAELTSIKATESASQQAYAEQLGDIRDQLNAARIRGDATEITRLESERARINSENIASGQRVEAAEKAATTAAGSFKALDDAAKKATNAFETAQKAMETASANAKLKESDIEIDKKRIGELNTDVAKNLSEAARQDIGYDIFSRPRLVVQNWHGIKDSDLPKKVSEKMKSEAEKKKIKEAITSDEEKKDEGGEQKPDEKKG